MRTLFSLIVSGTLAVTLFGCGTPEAEFSWSEETQDLMPSAREAVKVYTNQRFGTPANTVGWQRLPIAFGGVPGRVVKVHTEVFNPDTPAEETLVTGFDVDFLTQAMIAKYDANLDDRLAFWELPDEIQKEVTREKFDAADANQDGFLEGAEIGKVRTRSELWVKETVSRISKETAQELVGKELVFVNGTFQYSDEQKEPYKVKVTGFDSETGRVDIWPYIGDVPKGEKKSVELVFQDIVIDFGSRMRSGRHLYMRHCMHCHGVTGDGNGPTAKYLNPLPRDYRDGVFKFVSTRRDIVGGRANHADLVRILRDGIPGTYMPSFAMLKEEEVTDIVEYVRWLSLRGQYEITMATVVLGEYSNEALAKDIKGKPDDASENSIRSEKQKELKTFLDEELHGAMEEEVEFLLEPWHSSEVYTSLVFPSVPKPPSSPASIARGRQLYLGKCAVCHGATAEGNGENTRGYQKDPEGKEYPKPGFFDIWGVPIKPRNLTLGVYRGGRRPLDIYRRISQGIPGTPMQAFNAAFKDEQIWDLVDYVMSIPIDGAMPQGGDENLIALESGSEPPGHPTGENPPAQPQDGNQPGEKKPAVADSNRASKPSDENDE